MIKLVIPAREKRAPFGARDCGRPSGPSTCVCHAKAMLDAWLVRAQPPKPLWKLQNALKVRFSADDFICYRCPQFQIYFPPHYKCIILEAYEN